MVYLPLWKMMEFVSWDWMENHQIPWFQTTNQVSIEKAMLMVETLGYIVNMIPRHTNHQPTVRWSSWFSRESVGISDILRYVMIRVVEKMPVSAIMCYLSYNPTTQVQMLKSDCFTSIMLVSVRICIDIGRQPHIFAQYQGFGFHRLRVIPLIHQGFCVSCWSNLHFCRWFPSF